MNFYSKDDKDFEELLNRQIKLLTPLHTPLGPPKFGDWLYHHDEQGQTFKEYIHCKPNIPKGYNNIIYIQPIGEFSEMQLQIITLTGEFMELFFNLPIQIKKEYSLSNIPPYTRRVHPHWGVPQVLTKFILHSILKPNLPKDAAAYIAFTAEDLWPGEGWNFVFGQASLIDPIGVWSIYRNGNPDGGQSEFNLCLLRTMKTGAHETGHIFSMEHCIKYNCLMNGSNSQEEKDRRPLMCCPECMAKIAWATNSNPVDRYKKLMTFCKKSGLGKEAEIYKKYLDILIDYFN